MHAAVRRCRSPRWSACRSHLSALASGSMISSSSTPIASCRACSEWAACCRSSRKSKPPGDDAKQLSRLEAIISSMTPDERRRQHIINGSRRKRIAKGSGTSVEDGNRLFKEVVQVQERLQSPGGEGGGGRWCVCFFWGGGFKKRGLFSRVVWPNNRAAGVSSFVEILGHYNPRSK